MMRTVPVGPPVVQPNLNRTVHRSPIFDLHPYEPGSVIHDEVKRRMLGGGEKDDKSLFHQIAVRFSDS